MKTLVILSIAITCLMILLLILQVIRFLKENGKPAASEREKTTTSPVEKSKISSVMGKSKPVVRQSLPIAANSCQDNSKVQQDKKKSSTFADKKIDEIGVVSGIPDNEMEEIQVDISQDMPDAVDCFDEEIPDDIPQGIMQKELDSFNQLVLKGKVNKREEEQLFNSVSKIDNTIYFEQLVESFDKNNQQLLEEIRTKVRLKELSMMPHTGEKEINHSTIDPEAEAEMSDEELETFL